MDREYLYGPDTIGPVTWIRPKVAGPFVSLVLPATIEEAELFLPVTWLTIPPLLGSLAHALQRDRWEGSEGEIEKALDAMEWQISRYPVTRLEICGGEWGAAFSTLGTSELYVRQGNGLPTPPWEFRVSIVDGQHILEYRSIPE